MVDDKSIEKLRALLPKGVPAPLPAAPVDGGEDA